MIVSLATFTLFYMFCDDSFGTGDDIVSVLVNASTWSSPLNLNQVFHFEVSRTLFTVLLQIPFILMLIQSEPQTESHSHIIQTILFQHVPSFMMQTNQALYLVAPMVLWNEVHSASQWMDEGDVNVHLFLQTLLMIVVQCYAWSLLVHLMIQLPINRMANLLCNQWACQADHDGHNNIELKSVERLKGDL